MSQTGESAFDQALRDARISSETPQNADHFANMVYSYYEQALADDDVSDLWSEQKVKRRAKQAEYKTVA